MFKRMIDAVRRNHALEHATISVLLSHHGPQTRVLGRASPDGFYVYGDVSTERLKEFATEGLARLQRGESHLAVSPLCGTNLAVAGLLAGLASYVAMASRSNRLENLPNAVVAAIVAVLAAQPVGSLVQKHITTSPDLGNVRIVSVEPMNRGSRFHKVRTSTAS